MFLLLRLAGDVYWKVSRMEGLFISRTKPRGGGGGSLHKFRQGCSVEDIFHLPKR